MPWKQSEQRQPLENGAKAFHQNVLILNCGVVLDRPCLDAFARNILGEAVLRKLTCPPFEHSPQFFGNSYSSTLAPNEKSRVRIHPLPGCEYSQATLIGCRQVEHLTRMLSPYESP